MDKEDVMCLCVCVCVGGGVGVEGGCVCEIHNEILLNYEKEQNNAICSNMDGPRDFHTEEVNQGEKDKYHMLLLICGI